MHRLIWEKVAIVLIFWAAISGCSLRAQIFVAPLQASTTGSNPVDFEFRADGTMIAKGNSGVGSLLSTDQGGGTRLLWYPAVSAFRAGAISSGGTDWDAANIGSYSVAFGLDTIASGSCSAALGTANVSSNYATIAFGSNSTASGGNAIAMGNYAAATGLFSEALGSFSTAGNTGSMAIGYGNSAVGTYSTSLGLFSVASGGASVSVGFLDTASGDYSTAMGYFTTSSSYSSMTVGRFNIGGGNSASWVSTDPLFEIGNGTSTSAPADALVVYKNGNVAAQGVITAARGGDIPMYPGD